ncbi:MAG TPA: response regulator transcription factor [Ramlibacter sp.]
MPSSHARSIRVFVIAPPLFRWGLERLVQSESPRLQLTGGASDAREAALQPEECEADVVIYAAPTIAMDELGGLCAGRQHKLLLVIQSQPHALLDAAVLAGASGIVAATEPPPVLVKAIERVHAGELWLDRAATGRLFLEMARRKSAQSEDPEQGKIATLTLRERQTIAAMSIHAGAPGKVIAQRLCISEHTLRNHLTSIYDKLGLANRVDLYAYAARHRLQEAPSGPPLRRGPAAAIPQGCGPAPAPG